jgi:hypothetical protein
MLLADELTFEAAIALSEIPSIIILMGYVDSTFLTNCSCISSVDREERDRKQRKFESNGICLLVLYS